MSEHEFEPVRGLPAALPPGETILWQGAPRWTRLACEAFHVRAVAGYFALMLAWRTASAIGVGAAPAQAVAATLTVLPIAALAVGLLALFAWLSARTTVYTITNRRVVLRVGVALTKAFNLPFTVIERGDLKAFADGSGDVSLTLKAPNKLAFPHLWPHARPWRVAAPQPTLRAVPDAAGVARTLAVAMNAAIGVEVAPLAAPERNTSAPALGGRQAAAA